MNLPRWPVLAFFALALAAAVWRAPTPAAPAFAPPPPAATSALPAEFALEKLPAVAPFAHSASLAELPDGRLAAAWYAGAHEAAGDVAIWFSTRDGASWSAPRIVATRSTTAAATRAYVGVLGNPVLYAEDGRLLVGSPAVARKNRDPARYRGELKRYLGQDEPLMLGSRSYPPPQLVSAVLGALKTESEGLAGGPVSRAVSCSPSSPR